MLPEIFILASPVPVGLFVHLLCFCLVDEMYKDNQECVGIYYRIETIRVGTNYPVSKRTLRISGMIPAERVMMCRNELSLIDHLLIWTDCMTFIQQGSFGLGEEQLSYKETIQPPKFGQQLTRRPPL